MHPSTTCLQHCNIFLYIFPFSTEHFLTNYYPPFGISCQSSQISINETSDQIAYVASRIVFVLARVLALLQEANTKSTRIFKVSPLHSLLGYAVTSSANTLLLLGKNLLCKLPQWFTLDDYFLILNKGIYCQTCIKRSPTRDG